MKLKPWVWFVAGGVVVVALIVIGAMQSNKGKVESVQLARVRLEDVTSRVRAPGKIEPKTQVKISADIAGKVLDLRVKEGDRVKRGQLMLQLDDTQYRASHRQAQAGLASAKARLREAESSLRVSDANFERQRTLFQQRLLSQAEWDAASSVNEGARVAAATAREDVARGQASLESTADYLSKCRFLAPFDGVVSALNVEEGETVITGTMNNPGSQIMVVSDLSRMLVRAEVDETDVVDMRIGQKTRITVDAYPDTHFVGMVTTIGNTAKRSLTSSVEGQTNFEVEVVFAEDVPGVRPGMTADVDIETGTHAGTLAVPIQAVVIRTERELERAKLGGKGKPKAKRGAAIAAEDDTVGKKDKEIAGIFIVENDVARFVRVRTGLASETMIEVLGEVTEGSSVVSGPYKALRELKPGGKVKRETVTATGRK